MQAQDWLQLGGNEYVAKSGYFLRARKRR